MFKRSCKIFKISLFMILPLVPLILSANEGDITLEDCLRKSAISHPAIVKYKNILLSSEYKVKSKLSEFYPELSLGLSYSKSSAQYFDTSTQSTKTQKSDTYSVSLNASQIVFARLSSYYAYQISLIEKSIEQKNYQDAFNTITYNVKELYSSILLYQNQLEVLKKTLERRKQNHTIIKLSYNAGKEKITSVMESDASVKQTEYDIIEKTESLNLAKKILNAFMNEPESKNYHYLPITDIQIPYHETDVLQRARILSPALNIYYLRLKIEQMNEKTAWGEFLPSISLTGSYGYADTQFFPRYNNWNISLTISIPLFSGGSTYYKIKDSQ